MSLYRIVLGLVAASSVSQPLASQGKVEKSKPSSSAKTPPVCQLRGKVRAARMLKPLPFQFHKQRHARHPGRSCNPIDLTLPAAVVWVRGLPAQRGGKPRRFTVHDLGNPRVLVVRPGDTIAHKLGRKLAIRFVESPKQRWLQFVGRVAKIGKPLTLRGRAVLFDPGKLWRRTTVHAFASPFAVVTDADGRFALPALPPGEYEVVVEHEVLGRVVKRVELGLESKPVTFVFPVEPWHNDPKVFPKVAEIDWKIGHYEHSLGLTGDEGMRKRFRGLVERFRTERRALITQAAKR